MQLKQQIEPCMRITVQIPKDAAQRLRQLASDGNPTLRALGIRSVQLEGDSQISLNVGGQQIDIKVSDQSSDVGHVASLSVSNDGGGGVGIGGRESCTADISDLSQLLNVGNLDGANSNSAFVKLPQAHLQHQQHQHSATLVQQHQRSNMPPNINYVSNAGIGSSDGALSLQQQQILQHRRNMMLGGPSTSNAALKQQNAFGGVLNSQQTLQQQQQLQQPVFKSPNTVCPMDGKVPVPPPPVAAGNSLNSREFPFESMRQARVLQGRDNSLSTIGSSSAGSIPTPSGIPLATGKLAVAGATVNAGKGGMQHQLMSSVGPPPNVALKVIKNPQSGEMITTTVSTGSGKSQFLQPPPPPYPGIGTVTSPASQNPPASSKPLTNYLQSRGTSLPTITASSIGPAGTGPSNNIAMSSPLLVNLLQNDSNSVANQQSNQIKLSPLPSSQQQQQQQHHQQQLPLIHQQQQSPMMASMSPQQQVMNSPLRTTTPGSEFMMQQHSNQVQQQIISAPGTPDNVLSVPSSPTAVASNQMRSIPSSQQQVMLSPSNNNLFVQQQQQQQPQRFQQQQFSPQQAALLRQRQQQLQAANKLQNQQRFMSQLQPQQQQQNLQQSLGVNTMLANQQHQMRQVRVGSNSGVGSLSHQTPPSPLQQQQQLQQHQQRLIGQQQQQYLSGNSGNMSPATPHSPASSHHSMHSPHMPSQHSHQQLLSPSTTPAQSPLTASHLTQQLLPPPQSPSTGITHNSSSIHIVPSSPSAPTMNLPPPPDYNQAAASSRWPATLNKPMDSATKTSFQEFTRYQMQYNLQQQQTQQQQQQIISEIANSLPGASGTNNLQSSVTLAAAGSSVSVGSGPVIGECNTNSSAGISSGSAGADGALDSQSVDDLNDPLITLSDLDALTTNDLDALLPTLSCDIDSSLSLDDKNELESLLQDAKDLDLDLIEGMDIDETAAAASSLLVGDEQLPPNVALTMEQLHSQHQQNQQAPPQPQILPQQSQQIQRQLQPQQRQLQMPQNHTINQQQSQKILQHRLQQQQQQQNYIHQQNSVQQNPQQHQFQMTSNQQQLQFPSHKHPQQLFTNSSNSASTNTSMSNSAQSVHPPTQPKQFLINPLTGELEPSLSDDSETEAEQETLQTRNSNVINTSNVTNTSQGASYTTNNSTNSIYELLPNSSSHFSEDSNSNSCSTAISKLSTGEQNNGGSSTPQLLGAGSDTERSRDSLISNKSQKIRKAKANLSSTSSLNINTTLASNKPGDMGSPRSNSSSPSVGAMMTGGNISSKKSKSNLLREKLQQGLKEKKNKEIGNAGVVKPKKERARAGSKSKAVLTAASLAVAAQSQVSTQTNKNSAIINNLNSANTNTPPSASNSTRSTIDSAAATTSTTPTRTSATSTEKIKLRLKIGKSEPVQPSYKVDVTFSSENMHYQQQQSQLNAQQLASSVMQQKQLSHNQNQHASASQYNPNLNTPQPQHSLPTMQQQMNQQHTSMNPPQYQQQDSMFPHPSSTSLTEGTNVSPANLAPPINSASHTDEPRVPPLHISLRGGKNSIVIKNSRKERKKAQIASNVSDLNLSRTTVDNDSLNANKTKSHLKRSHPLSDNAISNNTSGDGTLEDQVGIEAKQTKLSENLLKTPISQINGMPNVTTQTHSNTDKLSNTLVAGKNGLTISTTSTSTIINNATTEANKSQNYLIDAQNLGSTNLGTVTNLPPQQLLQPSTQQQLAKITSLPNSITLSTITNPNNSSGSGGFGANSNSLQVKHNLKTTATITPIQGKPLTKNHKPPSYITAVQQLQLQKQQQQQQLAALAEKQTQQQMIAAAVTMLPSATTLKRVEITKVERKDALGNIEHVLIKSNESVTKSTSTTLKGNTQLITTATNTTATSTAPSISNVTSISLPAKVKTSCSLMDSATVKSESLAATTRNVITQSTNSSTTTGTITSALPISNTSTTIPNTNTNLNYNQSSSLANTLRNSPASTGGGTPAHGNSAGGEDSGIESMDALSEKSPHQLTSSSPQALQPQINLEKPPQKPLAKHSSEALKTSQEVETHLTIAEDEIEKALAKMEGLTEDDDNHLTIEDLKEKDKESFNKLNQQKANGEISIYDNDLIKQKDDKVVYNNIQNHHHHLDEDDDDDDDDLIKNLTASIIEEHEAGEKAAKEKLENERREKEQNLKELEENKEETKLRDIKNEDFEEKITNTTKIIKKDDSIKIEINCNNNNDKEKPIEVKKISAESLSKFEANKEAKIDEKPDCVINKHLETIHANLSTPISIEIPHTIDTDSPRIRTRASSRLGSPMDVIKPSPSIDSNLSTQSSLITKHVVSTRSSSHTHERVSVSPKLVQTSSSSSANTTVINSNASSASNASQMQHLQNHHKRKRRESEGCNNNTNSDTDSKRVRSGSTGGNSTAANEPTNNKKTDDAAPKTPNSTTKKTEESSDSDEPLIEVAGKVRSSKAAAVGSVDNTNNSVSTPNANNSSASSFATTNLENTSEKVTRNSRSHQQQNKTPAQVHNSATGSETNSTSSNTSKSGKVVNSQAGQSYHPNASCAGLNNSLPFTSNITATLTSNLNPSSAPMHATRGASHTSSVSISSTTSAPSTLNHTISATNNSNTPSDEKIGTRRSVRASAAANKMIYTRGLHNNNASNNISNNETAGKIVGKTSATNSSSDCVAEARRKTRSAVVGESLLTEGRRRRGSRDYK